MMINIVLGKYKDCSDLPDLINGHAECTVVGTRKTCSLECDEGYEFTSSENPSLQECIDGQWSYQDRQTSFPTCES